MAIKVELEVDGATHKLDSCEYSVYQDTDDTGNVSSEVKGGRINFSLKSTKSEYFLEWAIAPDERKSGKINFYRPDGNNILKTLEFSDAYVVDYSETIIADGASAMTETVTLSVKEFGVNGAKLKKHWAELD